MAANRYSVAGRTVASGATIDNAAFGLWNPHGSKAIYVRELWVFTTTATAMNLGLQRTSAAGTPVVTVTPDADNAYDRRAVPPSGALAYMDFSAEPTLQGPDLWRGISPAVIGAGFVIPFPEPFVVPFGTGLYGLTKVAVAFPVSDVTWVWDE